MKLPSLQYLTTNAKTSLLRFPLTLVSALIGVVLALYLFEYHEEKINFFPWINTMLCAALGIPLFFCAALVAERKQWEGTKKAGILIVAALVLLALYFTFPGSDSTHNTSIPYVRYGLYNLTIHLCVSVLPFAFSRQLNGYWNFNKLLFLRILLSGLYSGALFLGLVLALTALRLLFDVQIHEELYFEIWVVIVGLFNTWFFISGIPEHFDQLDAVVEYPKGLRIFSQYVLLPLLVLYLLILYSYGAKIIITWDWPRGIVAYLITFVSILGILTFLLLYPYGQQPAFSWIKSTSKIYYFVLVPLVVLLYMAILMRIDDYGITVNRYAVLLLALWISAVCLYTIFGKTNIKFIPVSLAITVFLCSFGPWSVFAVSERSQVHRLEKILVNSRILVDGKINNEPLWSKDSLPRLYARNENLNEARLTDSLHNEVKSILEYLDNHHGYAAIQPWYRQDLNSIVDKQEKEKSKPNAYYISESDLYMRSMGLKAEWRYRDNANQYYSYQALDHNNITQISGYDYMVSFDRNLSEKEPDAIDFYQSGDQKYEIRYEHKKDLTLQFVTADGLVRFDIQALTERLKHKYSAKMTMDIPEEDMVIIKSTTTHTVKLQLSSIGIEVSKKHPRISYIKGSFFIKKN